MERTIREQLNHLSKQVFGSSSRWQKIVDKGVAEPFERDREVMVTNKKGQIEKKVFTDKKSVVRHYSVDEVRTLMEDILMERLKKAEQNGTIKTVSENQT